jgi:hypothetical protein
LKWTKKNRPCHYLLLVFLLLPGASSHAQDVEAKFNSEFDPANFAHASFLGSGYYDVGGRQIFILRMLPGVRVRSADEHPWGLRVTFRSAFGFYDFRPTDGADFGLPDSLGSFSVAPGLEFHVPIKANWYLKPFMEAGPAIELEDDTVTYIYGFGVKSRAEFAAERSRFVLWNTVLWAGNWESDISPADHFAVLETTIEWRHRLPWLYWGHPAEIGPLIRSEFYFDVLEAKPPQGRSLDVKQRFEVGVYWGTVKREIKWKIPIPRVGLAVRFGDGDSGFRLGLSSRF